MVDISNFLKKTFKLKKGREDGNLEKVQMATNTRDQQDEKGDTDPSNKEEKSKSTYKRLCLPLNYEELFRVDRPTLGRYVDVVVFRAFVFSIIKYLGFNSTHKIYSAGKGFGKSLRVRTMDDLIRCFRELGIGIVEVVEKNPVLKIRIYESVFCSGLPNIGECVCHYEKGILAGCLENILNKKVEVVETRCCACGDDYCEFEVRIPGDM